MRNKEVPHLYMNKIGNMEVEFTCNWDCFEAYKMRESKKNHKQEVKERALHS